MKKQELCDKIQMKQCCSGTRCGPTWTLCWAEPEMASAQIEEELEFIYGQPRSGNGAPGWEPKGKKKRSACGAQDSCMLALRIHQSCMITLCYARAFTSSAEAETIFSIHVHQSARRLSPNPRPAERERSETRRGAGYQRSAEHPTAPGSA